MTTTLESPTLEAPTIAAGPLRVRVDPLDDTIELRVPAFPDSPGADELAGQYDDLRGRAAALGKVCDALRRDRQTLPAAEKPFARSVGWFDSVVALLRREAALRRDLADFSKNVRGIISRERMAINEASRIEREKIDAELARLGVNPHTVRDGNRAPTPEQSARSSRRAYLDARDRAWSRSGRETAAADARDREAAELVGRFLSAVTGTPAA